jgi:beta-galactosidase/evolved beta-galactosidase subunit alpha
MIREKSILNINDNDWNNYKVLSRNREKSRVHFYPYENEEKALKYDKAYSKRVKMLNGEWDFKWYESPVLIDLDRLSELKDYDTIQVPKNWQFEGHGKFVYTDMWYDFPVDVPYVSGNQNETGLYHRTFTLAQKPDRLAIRFEGVESAFHVYINGQLIGYSQGSRYPSEFDISKALLVGENDIHVIVYQYCDGSYLEAQDMWWLGGIIRDVYLIERKPCFIENLILDPDYDWKTQTGYLNTNISIEGQGQLSLRIYDEDKLHKEIQEVPLKGPIAIEEILPWTSETPKLYTLIFTLRDDTGSICEVVPQRVGFRHLEIVEGDLRLNGKRFMLKGINRHEYSAWSGRAITYEETLAELQLIKDYHMNAIRTSHYPNNSFFYDLCNALGIYVIDEADLESHGLEVVKTDTLMCDDPIYQDAYIDRVERMVERDRNHACVVMWSLGNESAYGVNFKAMYEWCKKHEPSRPVHYEGDAYNESVDVSSTMYSSVGKLYELDREDIKKPHILCEFGHAMGNGPGSLKEYVDLMETSNRIQGFFIWEFKDQGVYQKDECGIERFLFGGEFGEDFHNGNFCMDGMVMANNQPTPGLEEYAKLIEHIQVTSWDVREAKVGVKNRFDFIDTSMIDITYKLLHNHEHVLSLTEAMPIIGPQEEGFVHIPGELLAYESEMQAYLHLEFTFRQPMNGWSEGTVLGHHVLSLKETVQEIIGIKESLDVEEKNGILKVIGKTFELSISKQDGYIQNLIMNGVRQIEKGPKVNFFRAYTDNDVKNEENWELQHLHAMTMNVYSIKYQQSDCKVQVDVHGRVGARGLSWGCNTNLTYHISQDGYIRLEWSGVFVGPAPKQLPKIGLQLEVSKSFSNVTYKGEGPGECYRDSRENAYAGVYSMPYEQLSFPYMVPQENGNRTNVSWASLSSEKGGIQFASENMDFSVRDTTDIELNRAKHQADLKKASNLIVNCDMINSGLGSQSCGPDRMNQYKAITKNFTFDLVIKPFASTKGCVDVENEIIEAAKLLAYRIEESR